MKIETHVILLFIFWEILNMLRTWVEAEMKKAILTFLDSRDPI